MKIESVDQIIDRAIYLCEGIVKQKPRHFQVVKTEKDDNAIIAFVPCIGGTALPINPDGIEEGLQSGELVMTLVETP